MSPLDQLALDLNADTLERRLAAAGEIGNRIVTGEVTRNRSGELNNHVHTIYSFSPYSPSAAAYQAWRAGLMAVGIMDHDSVAGCREMLEASRRIGISSTVGFELRVNMTGTSMEGRKLNNPDSKNIAYIAVHGIPDSGIDEAGRFLEPIHRARVERNRRMTDRLNEVTASWGIDTLDYYTDVEASSKADEGGSVTERHLLFALAQRMISALGKGQGLLDFLEKKAGLVLAGKIRGFLLDIENPHYAYDLLGVFKSSVVSEIYLQPNDEECVGVREAVAFAKKIGAIPAYAYLGDVTDSPTGDKKAEAFEDAFLDELFVELRSLAFEAVTYMPPRNTIKQLLRVQELCNRHGLMEISGVDINSSRQSFNCPELLKDEFRHLGAAAWALIAHEKLSTIDVSYGLFNDANPYWRDSTEQRVSAYGKIGASLDPREPESAALTLETIAGEELV